MGDLRSFWLISFELMLYGFLCLCARHAWKTRGLAGLWELGAGVAFGVFLEWATIRQLHAYHYGRYLLMLGDVPLAVGVGWGVIIYTARLFSDATSTPHFLRPALDGLLALNIDLSMDAVAIRLGMWHWGIRLTDEYFGVPYANFWAWFWVVCSFSAGLRLFAHRGDRRSQWYAPAAGIAVGAMVVLSTNELIVSYIPPQLYVTTIIAVIGIALALVLLAGAEIDRPSLPPIATAVPLGIHLYFLCAGLATGIFIGLPFLMGMSVLMTLAALYLHLPLKARIGRGRGV